MTTGRAGTVLVRNGREINTGFSSIANLDFKSSAVSAQWNTAGGPGVE